MILYQLGLPNTQESAAQVHLIVSGVQLVRCVMKGSIHAVNNGFKVHVLASASDGGQVDKVDKWVPSGWNGEKEKYVNPEGNAPGNSCEATMCYNYKSFCPNGKCTRKDRRKWSSLIYGDKGQGGPTMATACQLMQQSGVKIYSIEDCKTRKEDVEAEVKGVIDGIFGN